jgi:hypothetical protein
MVSRRIGAGAPRAASSEDSIGEAGSNAGSGAPVSTLAADEFDRCAADSAGLAALAADFREDGAAPAPRGPIAPDLVIVSPGSAFVRYPLNATQFTAGPAAKVTRR